MKQTKSKKRITTARIMVNSNGIDFGNSKISLCKCQNCNNIKLQQKPLKKNEIKQMFIDLLN